MLADKPDIRMSRTPRMGFLGLSRLQTMVSSAVASVRNKMQKVLQFASEHRQRIFRVSYVALVLPILVLTSTLHAALFQLPLAGRPLRTCFNT